MAIDFKKLGAEVAKTGVDMTKATQGGGDYEPPAAGPVRLRFVAYVELGKQKTKSMGKDVVKERVQLVFELSGPKHPPRELEDGTKVPHRVTITENLSLNEKANFYKLFQRLNYAGKATHIVQLLGNAYKATILHRTYKGRDGQDRIAVELKGDAGYTIEAPRFEKVDPETQEPTGEFAVLKVDPPISELRCFLWAHADKEQWDSLFIEGAYEERKDDKGNVTAPARSKNVFQDTIKRAENFKGSPIYTILAAAGANLDIPDVDDPEGEEPEAAKPPSKPAKPAAKPVPEGDEADDELNGVV